MMKKNDQSLITLDNENEQIHIENGEGGRAEQQQLLSFAPQASCFPIQVVCILQAP